MHSQPLGPPQKVACFHTHHVTQSVRAVLTFLPVKICQRNSLFRSPRQLWEGILGGPLEAVTSLSPRGDSAVPCVSCQEREEGFFKSLYWPRTLRSLGAQVSWGQGGDKGLLLTLASETQPSALGTGSSSSFTRRGSARLTDPQREVAGIAP